MLELDDVFELSLWGLELIVDTGASAGSGPAGPLDAVRRRGSRPRGSPREARPAAAAGPARVADPFSPIGRLPYLASEAGITRGGRVAPRRRAGDEKLTKKA